MTDEVKLARYNLIKRPNTKAGGQAFSWVISARVNSETKPFYLGGSDKTEAEALERLKELDVEIARSTHKLVEEASRDLTTEQTARFYLFLGDFDEELRHLVYRAKRHAERKNSKKKADDHRPASPASPGKPLTPKRD